MTSQWWQRKRPRLFVKSKAFYYFLWHIRPILTTSAAAEFHSCVYENHIRTGFSTYSKTHQTQKIRFNVSWSYVNFFCGKNYDQRIIYALGVCSSIRFTGPREKNPYKPLSLLTTFATMNTDDQTDNSAKGQHASEDNPDNSAKGKDASKDNPDNRTKAQKAWRMHINRMWQIVLQICVGFV